MPLQELIKDFEKNDWRQISIQEKKEPKHGYTPKYKEVIDTIKRDYPEIPFPEATFIVKNNLPERQSCINCGEFDVFRLDPSPQYMMYCSHKCRSEHKNTVAEAIIIDGKQYKDFGKAMEELNLSRYHIRQRVFDPAYPNYRWDVSDHDAKCIEKLRESHPTMADKSFFEEWKRSKMSRQWLSDQLGLSADTIKTALIFFEIETSFEQVNDIALELKKDPIRLKELYDRYSTEEIAQMFNVSPSAILQWLKMYGYEIDAGKSQSAIERYLIDYIKTLDPSLEILERDRSYMGFELDIFIPSKNIAIECDGLFYHSELPTKADKEKHAFKQEACQEKGITLLRFVDASETADKERLEIVKSIIASKLGYTNKIHARKCKIVMLQNYIGVDFFEKNHISGNRGASVYYGLMYENELVMCMSFGHPIMSKKHDWEIIRMAAKQMTTVIGGASRLFKHFLKNHSGSVMSYANLRFGSGKVYNNLGLNSIGNTGPGYFYTDYKKVYSRHKFQKGSIENMCPDYISTLTESQNAERNGYKVYWDCGNNIYEMIR